MLTGVNFFVLLTCPTLQTADYLTVIEHGLRLYEQK